MPFQIPIYALIVPKCFIFLSFTVRDERFCFFCSMVLYISQDYIQCDFIEKIVIFVRCGRGGVYIIL